MTTDRHWALDTATFSLLGSKRKSIPLGAFSSSDEVMERIEIGACYPWNLSTVPVLLPSISAWEIRLTWAL